MEQNSEYKQLRLPILYFQLEDPDFLRAIRDSTLLIKYPELHDEGQVERSREFLQLSGLMLQSA